MKRTIIRFYFGEDGERRTADPLGYYEEVDVIVDQFDLPQYLRRCQTVILMKEIALPYQVAVPSSLSGGRIFYDGTTLYISGDSYNSVLADLNTVLHNAIGSPS